MQTTRADVLGALIHFPCGFGDAADAVLAEAHMQALGGEQGLVLLGQRGARFGEDALKVVGGEGFEFHANRQAALQFWNKV